MQTLTQSLKIVIYTIYTIYTIRWCALADVSEASAWLLNSSLMLHCYTVYGKNSLFCNIAYIMSSITIGKQSLPFKRVDTFIDVLTIAYIIFTTCFLIYSTYY